MASISAMIKYMWNSLAELGQAGEAAKSLLVPQEHFQKACVHCTRNVIVHPGPCLGRSIT